MGSLHVEDLDLEGAQADEHVAARVGRVRGVYFVKSVFRV